MTESVQDPLDTAATWLDADRDVALATVVSTWGSAPRPTGSQLVIDGAGNFEGSVSGGCVEGAVVDEALSVLETGKPRMLEFGVADETAWQVGLSCGGKIRVYVEKVGAGAPLSPDLLKELNLKRQSRIGTIDLVRLGTGDHELVYNAQFRHKDAQLDAELKRAFRADKSRSVETEGQEYFVHVFSPATRLVVIGAVHISQALLPMARILGFDVTIIDPRLGFATPERFPDIELLADWPQDVMGDLKLDRYTAVATLTHDPKIDDPALIAALRSNCFYVGALGGTKTHAKRVERLKEAGLGEAEIDRIHAPIGLDIGAQSPAEIALATLGQMVAALRAGV